MTSNFTFNRNISEPLISNFRFT